MNTLSAIVTTQKGYIGKNIKSRVIRISEMKITTFYEETFFMGNSSMTSSKPISFVYCGLIDNK